MLVGLTTVKAEAVDPTIVIVMAVTVAVAILMDDGCYDGGFVCGCSSGYDVGCDGTSGLTETWPTKMIVALTVM